jgi:hypothetical protein
MPNLEHKPIRSSYPLVLRIESILCASCSRLFRVTQFNPNNLALTLPLPNRKSSMKAKLISKLQLVLVVLLASLAMSPFVAAQSAVELTSGPMTFIYPTNVPFDPFKPEKTRFTVKNTGSTTLKYSGNAGWSTGTPNDPARPGIPFFFPPLRVTGSSCDSLTVLPGASCTYDVETTEFIPNAPPDQFWVELVFTTGDSAGQVSTPRILVNLIRFDGAPVPSLSIVGLLLLGLSVVGVALRLGAYRR